jgi:DHA1 family bicyclomycin/chloramphenicol resistance-like MFS transporter
VVSATYIALFYNTPNPDVRVLLLFFAMQFFSIGFFLVIYVLWPWSRGTHCGIAAAVTGFISTIMAVPISILLAVLLQIGCHYLWLFDMCSIISRITYLFKIDEKRATSENRI